MTEAGKMSVSQLLKVGEGEFDQAIREMKVKDLMETISGLQKEMSKEQENFNFLSGELQNRKERNSRQYKQISKDMMASQQRLTLLMNRSMKCFSQQNTQQSGDGSPLKRRNSAKGIKPIIDSASKSTNIHRSKSLHAVNQPTESDSTPPKHHPAVATAAYGPSMNKSHKPIIMRTGLNGNNNNILKTTATTNHINTKSETKGGNEKSHAPLSMGDGHVKEGEGKEWSSVMANTESSGAGNCSVGGGGLYVKRKPGQMSRITTTASVSSSRVLPPSDQQFSSVASTSLPSSSSSSSHTPVATASLSSSSNLPSRSIASTTSSFSNDFLFLKSKPPPNSGTNAMIQSPLQNLRSNEGISKSQTITPQDPNSNPQQEFRGLPSVRLLAQSFGSSTALNVNPSQNTNQRLSGSHTNLLPGKGVVRSSSSVNLSTSKQPNTSNRMFPTKSNTGDLNQQEEPVVYINGKQQLNRVPVNTTQNNGNNTGGPNELELARGRLRANRNLRETTGDTSDVGNSAEVASPVSDFSNYESQSKEQRMLEKVRAGPYIKKKDITSSKPTSNAPAPASSSVTVKSINSASSLATSNMANAAVPSIKRSSSPPPASSVSLSQNFSLKTATSGPTAATEKYSSSSQKGTSKTLHSDYKNNPTNNSNGIGNNTDTFMANLPPTKPSVTSGRVISTAAVTIRRAKSREELQEIENQTWSNKDSLLKQIQARRRDDYDSPDNGGSNFKAMSKLSQSMPSLLHEGRIFIDHNLCTQACCFS